MAFIFQVFKQGLYLAKAVVLLRDMSVTLGIAIKPLSCILSRPWQVLPIAKFLQVSHRLFVVPGRY